MNNNKKIKNDYRNEHTDIDEYTVGVGKHMRTVRTRIRRSGSPSLKEYAKTHSEGREWLKRKAQQKNKHVRTVRLDREPRGRRGTSQ